MAASETPDDTLNLNYYSHLNNPLTRIGGLMMGRSRSRKRAKGQMLMMAGIPVNRPYSYEKPFFKEAAPVLQGILFPLKTKSFKSGKVKLGEIARGLGASQRGLDARNISYPGG